MIVDCINICGRNPAVNLYSPPLNSRQSPLVASRKTQDGVEEIALGSVSFANEAEQITDQAQILRPNQ
jgi:hypothetical protein